MDSSRKRTRQTAWINSAKKIRRLIAIFQAINNACLSVQINRSRVILPIRDLNDLIIAVREAIFVRSEEAKQPRITEIEAILEANSKRRSNKLSDTNELKLKKELGLLTKRGRR